MGFSSVLVGIQEGYQLVAGERPPASRTLGRLTEVPVLLVSITDQESLENRNDRKPPAGNLNPIEEAIAYDTLIRSSP
jgi:ParB family chromosome partitioning protein